MKIYYHKKIIKAKDIIINRDYIHSDEFKYGLIPGLNMENFIPHDEASTDDYENAAELYRHPTGAKVGAEIVNNSIQEAMMDYFA